MTSDLLHQQGIVQEWHAGLTRDLCILWTFLEAAAARFGKTRRASPFGEQGWNVVYIMQFWKMMSGNIDV